MKRTLIAFTVFTVLFTAQLTGHALEVESLGVDIHGFISQGFLKSTSYNYLANDANKGSFQFNEMGINFGKQVTDDLRIGAQFFARDLGDVANNKVIVDWAYGDYRFKDWLGVRAGRIKIPFGLYGDIRDMDMLRTCIILPQGIYDDLMRDAMIAMNGAAVYGTVQVPKAGSFEYQAQVGVGHMDADSGVGKYLNSSLSGLGTLRSSFNTKTIYAGGLRWNTPLPGLSLKGTLLLSESDVPLTVTLPFPPYSAISTSITVKNKRQVYSAEYIWNDLTLVLEYMINQSDNSGSGMSFSYRNESYYGMATYRFLDWLEAGGYYSIHYPNTGDKNGDRYAAAGQPDYFAWQKDAAVFARFDLNSYLNLKVEGHYIDGVADVLSIDNPVRDNRNWWYFAAKATFSF